MAAVDQPAEVKWFEIEIPLRGCRFDLKQIQRVYGELDELNRRERDRIIGDLKKPIDQEETEFESFKQSAFEKAFKITTSIIGSDDNITRYGEDKSIFDSGDLPYPIKTIYFTNVTAFKGFANGNEPKNYFQIWINFNKPPLFDPTALLSEPTVNGSRMKVKSHDTSFFRAAQNIANSALKKDRLWLAPIHGRFAYDIGLWFFFMPYGLFTITKLCDKIVPSDGPNSSFRVAFYIYGIGLGLLAYRALYGYFKWAFPVNVLKENHDKAAAHRIFFATIMLGILINLCSHLVGV